MMALWMVMVGACVFMLMFTLTTMTGTERQLLVVLWFVMAILFGFEILTIQRRSSRRITNEEKRDLYRQRLSVKPLNRPRVTTITRRPMLPRGRR